MTISSSSRGWIRPILVDAEREIGRRDSTILTLSEYPEVGRVEEVAAVLRCSKWCVYDLISAGALKSIRLGRAIRVTRRALGEFLGL
jgi:excisionase family DNA binding protein